MGWLRGTACGLARCSIDSNGVRAEEGLEIGVIAARDMLLGA